MGRADPRAILTDLVAENGESLAALSRMLGRNDAWLQQYLRRGTPRDLPERERSALSRYFGITESMLGGPSSDDVVVVSALDIDAAAGGGALSGDVVRRFRRRLDAELLRGLGVRPENAAMIRVLGDSMAPTLADGDEILVDSSRRSVDRRGGLYVLRHDGTLMVKRLRPKDGDIAVVSDNPAYPPFMLPRAQADIVGRVAWLARIPA